MEWARAACAFDARFGGTRVIFCRHPYPNLTLCRTGEIQLTAISALIVQLPDHYLGKHAHFILGTRAIMTKVFQTPRAKIIRTTLQHRKTKIKIQRLTEI